CPYCGSSYVLSNKQIDVITPDGIIPFTIDKVKLNQVFSAWIKGRWLAPNDLKNLFQKGKFQGVYLPYWTFDAKCRSSYTAQGGRRRTEHYKDSEGNDQTRTVTDWYPTSGEVGHFFDDVQTTASTRLKGGLLKGIQPFDFKGLVSYDPKYLSGYLSENYSISLEDGHKTARKIMEDKMKSLASQQVLRQYDEVKNINLISHYSEETYKYVLVPAYSTSYSFKGKVYNVVINGQNGKVDGEYPKSYVKIALIVIAIIIVLVIIFAASSSSGAEIETDKSTIEADYTIEDADEDDIYASVLEVLAGYDDVDSADEIGVELDAEDAFAEFVATYEGVSVNF
ncbi:MAG: hypothetical protein K6G11_04915, partial [Lachnospiraceae bacterium]|nr:hypothetical protein [Lachnospiraceae bacterium]